MKKMLVFDKKYVFLKAKKSIGFFLLIFVLSCSEANYIDEPKNLISKDKMAEILADLALNDQTSFVVPSGGNMENGTRFILKKNNVKSEDFLENYTYYVVNKKMEKIIEKSQEIIKDKDPSAADFIENKLKTKDKMPTFAK